MSSNDKPPRNWPKDFFGRSEMEMQLMWIIVPAILLIALWWSLREPSASSTPSSLEVIVYAAQDQVFAEPILKQFEQQ